MNDDATARAAAIDELDRLSRTRALTDRESRELEKLIIAERAAKRQAARA